MHRSIRRPEGWLLSLAAFTLLFPGIAHAAFPGANGKIAFAKAKGGAGVYVMNADGSGQRRLVKGGHDPAWSPNGRKLAFVRGSTKQNDIFTVNANGKGRRRLTNRRGVDTQPVWSPNGRKIAFASGTVRLPYIFTMKADGRGRKRLTSGAGRFEVEPAWSPNGRTIAFTKGPFRDVFAVNASGRGERQLTGTPNSADPFFDFQPDWSPDGRKIAFTSGRDDNGEIYVMNADGSGQTRLTNNPVDEIQPAWSPDGRKIAFATQAGIYTMNADGSGLTKMTDDGFSPDWQPVKRK
jgi:Tol biopolymer transport system component